MRALIMCAGLLALYGSTAMSSLSPNEFEMKPILYGHANANYINICICGINKDLN